MGKEFCKFLKHGLVYNNNTTNFTVSPCCYFNKTYNIDLQSDVSAQLTTHKSNWLAEDVTSTCKICINQETSGISSYRSAANDIVNAHEGIVMLTVAVNKQCNLACPTCGPEYSSFWYLHNLEHHEPVRDSIVKIHQQDRSAEITDTFVSLLKTQNLDNLRYIKFGGGEPFLNDTHLQILNSIPNPGEVTVQYTSNFTTIVNSNISSTWEKFKLIKWSASVDGIEDRFEFLRWPYKWEKFLATKEKIVNMVPTNVMFAIEHTLNPLNVFYYDEYEKWAQTNFLTNRLGDNTDLNIHYASGVLSLEKTTEKFRNLIYEKYGTEHKISKLLMNLPYDNDTRESVVYLDKLDSWRKTDWRTLFPVASSFYV